MLTVLKSCDLYWLHNNKDFFFFALDESNVKKKKKKKKFKKNNKTAPMPVEGIDEGKAPGLPSPLGTPSWANPTGQRNIFIKASKQPSLEPLMEANAQKLNPISSNSKLEPVTSSKSSYHCIMH